jgi:hypothetical protein
VGDRRRDVRSRGNPRVWVPKNRLRLLSRGAAWRGVAWRDKRSLSAVTITGGLCATYVWRAERVLPFVQSQQAGSGQPQPYVLGTHSFSNAKTSIQFAVERNGGEKAAMRGGNGLY